MDFQQQSNGEGGGETSKFNDSILSIGRLNEHWLACERFANEGNLMAWKFRLDSVWRELTPDVERLKNKSGKEGFDIEKLNELLKLRIARAKGRSLIYVKINARHEFLRKVQDKAGKAGAYIDEDDEGFE